MNESAENIDMKFSPSRILDQMFYDGTSPDVIVTYLQQSAKSKEEMQKLFDNSDCFARIFQLDFVLNLDSAMQDWVIEQFPLVSRSLVLNLCWQVYSSRSYAADRMKYKFHKIFESKSFRTEIIRHPYSSKLCESGIALDEKLFKLVKTHKNVCECIQRMNQRYILDWILESPKSSLFMERLFQEDVFRNLDAFEMHYMVNKLSSLPFDVEYRFVRQVLQSDAFGEIGIEVKRSVISKFRGDLCNIEKYYQLYKKVSDAGIDQGLLTKAIVSNSFSMLYITAAACGKDCSSHLAMLLLANHNKNMNSMLKEWLEIDRTSLLNALDLEDAICNCL